MSALDAPDAPRGERVGDDGDSPSPFSVVAMVQGIFYVATGVWPFVSLDTFLRVTGPKEDVWLVVTVAALIIVIGLALIVASLRRRPRPEIALLGGGTALALGAVDVYYVLQRVISPVYLLDAVAEGALVVAWVAVMALARGDPGAHRA